MNRLLTIGLVTGLLMSSCSDLADERKQVADLLILMENEQERLLRLHPDSLPMTSQDISSRLNSISAYYTDRGEFMDKGMGLLLADFKVFTKVFKGLSQKRIRLQQEIDLSVEQLQDLDRDLKNKAIDRANALKYIQDESEAAKSISSSLDKLDTLMARGGRGYLRMVPKIDSVIDSLSTLPSE